jgi:hypothetical protein
MPKRQPNGNQPKFLQFRPYHAFTTTPADQDRKGLWKILWIIGVIALMFAVAFIFLQTR